MGPIYVVTGAAGHLGSTVIRTVLEQNKRVRGLILPTESPVVEGAQYIRGDIREPERMAALFDREDGQPLYLIHTAGIVDITGRISNDLYDVNVTGTKNVIALCKKYSVDKLVYTSSVHAIPELPQGTVHKEVEYFSSDLVSGGYAKTKAEATQAVLDAAHMGLPAVVVHPSGILGPYDQGRNHLVQMVKDAMEGRLPACVPGGYDIVDVRDVALGCFQALEHGRVGGCYIFSGHYATLKDILSFVAILCGHRPPVVLPMKLARATEPLLGTVAKVQGRRPLFTRYSLDTVSGNALFSSQKAAQELGYVVRSLKATIRDTVEWLMEHPNNKN